MNRYFNGNKPKNADEIEMRLGRIFERSLDDGSSIDFLDEYFMFPDERETDLPVWADALAVNGRKKGCQTKGERREGLSGEGPDALPLLETVPCPPITNRGVTTYRTPNPDSSELLTVQDLTEYTRPENMVRGGYDGGVEVGFTGSWESDSFQNLLALLETKRSEAENAQNETEFGNPAPAYVEIAGRPLIVKPVGAKCGIYYRYVLEGGGLKIYVHQNPKKDMQAVRVRYNAEALIANNLFSLHEQVLLWLASLGFSIQKETLSRVDMQIMLPERADKIISLILCNHAVAKARRDDIRRKNGRLETYTPGNIKAIQLCIYDKRAELCKALQADPVKYELMHRNSVGDWIEQGVSFTRVEFRLGRDALRAVGIDTVDDLQRHETALAEFLCVKWFRVLEKPKVRGHENTAQTHPVWREVERLFALYFPGLEGVREAVAWSKPERISCDTDALEKQAAGCLAKVNALRNGNQANIDECRESIFSIIATKMKTVFDKGNQIASYLQTLKGVTLGMEAGASGELACVKIGRLVRFRPEDIEALLQRKRMVLVRVESEKENP